MLSHIWHNLKITVRIFNTPFGDTFVKNFYFTEIAICDHKWHLLENYVNYVV
jgi:hypothetical protein